MQEQNPYTPLTTEETIHPVVVNETQASSQKRLFNALAIGVICCLIGPIFLTLFYAYHGNGLGLSATLSFLGIAYLAPGLLAVAMGLPIGHLLSLVSPRLGSTARPIVVTSEITVLFSIGIYLLLNKFLNFGIGFSAFELPAFSATCGLIALITTSVYLAVS